MSNSNNRIIVFASILGAILVTGILALNPSTITNAQAMPYGSEDYDYRHSYSDQYGDDSNYYQDDNRYSYDKKDSKSSHGNIQKISCVNGNINVNGIDISQIPEDNNVLAAANEGGAAEAANTQNGNGFAERINLEKNLVNFCINNNDNSQERQQQSESNGLTVGSLYIVNGTVVTNQSPFPTTSTAQCDTGDFVISGGFYETFPPGFLFSQAHSIASNPTPELDGWSATFHTLTAQDRFTIQATAVCFDTP
jgi:hypothetical protein